MSDEEPLDVRFEMRATKSWVEAVDDWRAAQRPMPSRAEAIRRLVEKGLLVDGDTELRLTVQKLQDGISGTVRRAMGIK